MDTPSAASVRAFLRRNWLWLALTVFVIAPLLWTSMALLTRSGLLTSSGPLSPEEVRTFLVFLASAFATTATIIATLTTRNHNAGLLRQQELESARENARQRLDTAVRGIDLLPPAETRARVAGVLTTLVLLGHERAALRVLGSAWDDRSVDDATATWVIGQVLAAVGDHPDEVAATEAAELLLQHTGRLTDRERQRIAFPGALLSGWDVPDAMSANVKLILLETIGTVLTSREQEWWNPNGGLSFWPTAVLLECAEKDRHPDVRAWAAVLVSALAYCFPAEFRRLGTERLAAITKRTATADAVPEGILAIADTIRGPWRTGAASGPSPWSFRRFMRRSAPRRPPVPHRGARTRAGRS